MRFIVDLLAHDAANARTVASLLGALRQIPAVPEASFIQH
jgi:hypothetical protein